MVYLSTTYLLEKFRIVKIYQILKVFIGHSTVCSTAGSGAHKRKQLGSELLALCEWNYWWPVDSPHKRPVMQKRFPCQDVFMESAAGDAWGSQEATVSAVVHQWESGLLLSLGHNIPAFIAGDFQRGLVMILVILNTHYSDVIMDTMASQITSLTIVYSTVYSGADERKHKSSTSLAVVRGIHRWSVNSAHKSASNAENGSIW